MSCAEIFLSIAAMFPQFPNVEATVFISDIEPQPYDGVVATRTCIIGDIKSFKENTRVIQQDFDSLVA